MVGTLRIILLFNFFYIFCIFGLKLTSELQTLKIATESTDSQIFTFVDDTQIKQKSEMIELET